MEENWLTEDWQEVENALPEGWREKATELGAIERLRKISGGGMLLRMVLMHVGGAISLKQTVVRGMQRGLPALSAVALFKRLKNCTEWLRWMCVELLREQGGRSRWEMPAGGLRMLAVDGTDILEPGKSGAAWKLHYAIELPGALCAHAIISGKGEGESLRRYPVERGDLLAGDRIFCSEVQIRHVLEAGGHVLLRWHSTNLPLFDAGGAGGRGKGAEFDVVGWLRKEAGERAAEKEVRSAKGLALRLCATPVSEEAAERERAKLRNAGRKQGREPSERSLELAGYIVLVTTLPREGYSLGAVMGLYRLRWQVELAFKRLKSLLGVAHVPKRDPDSARAWMQAKMLISLLIEKLLLDAEVFSPWGYILVGKQPLGRVRRSARLPAGLPGLGPVHLAPSGKREKPSRPLR